MMLPSPTSSVRIDAPFDSFFFHYFTMINQRGQFYVDVVFKNLSTFFFRSAVAVTKGKRRGGCILGAECKVCVYKCD